MDYFQLQETVFKHLWNKHQQDNSFTFSVRQMASKGAEKNHFIGTSKSSYFAFTCWDIYVSYPGSSGDLMGFIFQLKDNACSLKFEFGIARNITGDQNLGDLSLGHELLKRLQSVGVDVSPDNEAFKMLYFQVPQNPKAFNNENDLLGGWEQLYSLVAPHVDAAIGATKLTHPNWQASRYSQQRFNTLINKMEQRIQRFLNSSQMEVNSLPEDDDALLGTNAMSLKQIPALNTILYGPPGTGKTYNTINKAVQITNPSFLNEERTREDIKREFERLKSEGQIEFITFHQSMSYEDFIEGIKPKKPEEGETYLKYEIESGLFKRMVARAAYQPTQQAAVFSLTDDEFNKTSFYKISLGNTAIQDDEQIYRYCIDNNCIGLGWGNAIDFTGKSEHEIQLMVPSKLGKFEAQAVSYFIHYLKTGDYVVVSNGNLRFRAIGKVTSEYEYRNIEGLEVREVKQFRKVQWLLKDVDIPVEELYNKQFSQQTIYKLNKSEIKREFFVKGQVSKKDSITKKNYVLIIDEINRGNIAQIFGELITLIESDKRKGAAEELEVMLPYSKEPFGVPSNLYILGTMNTADRSVEALDTALRRRFVFEEMKPQPKLLSPKEMMVRMLNLPESWNYDWHEEKYREKADDLYELLGTTSEIEKDLIRQEYDDPDRDWILYDLNIIDDTCFTGLNLQALLNKINERLEALLTKDHTIGHAWLMEVYSLADLQNAFKNKILPLLQEYFYNNYAKIGLVLGKAFIEQKQAKGIFAKDFDGDNDLKSDYEDKIIYSLSDPFELELQNFIDIYE
jgi:5-methylcytosine-specific restriction endonuclease McrBC GTP-binding regulatory subunit McrB